MGKGKNIEGYVKAYVFRRARQEPKTPRDELAKKLVGELRAMKRTPPAIKTLKKRISAARNQEASPQDQPWHLGTLEKYPVPPEALRTVLMAWQYESEEEGIHLTIREVKWIGRLYALLRDSTIEKVTGLAIILAERDQILEEAERLGAPYEETSSYVGIDFVCGKVGIEVRDRHAALMEELRWAEGRLSERQAELQAHKDDEEYMNTMTASKRGDEWTRKTRRERMEENIAFYQGMLARVNAELESISVQAKSKRAERLNKVKGIAKNRKEQKKAEKKTSGPETDVKTPKGEAK